MVSILGMFLMGIEFVQGLAVGVALAVAIAVAAAVTLLPAILGFLGGGIDRLRIGRRRRETPGLWHRWARVVQRRPGTVAAIGFGVLLLAAASGASRCGWASPTRGTIRPGRPPARPTS